MKQEIKDLNEIDFSIKLNYAVVIHGQPNDIAKLNDFLRKNNFKVRYIKTSNHFLKIIEEVNHE